MQNMMFSFVQSNYEKSRRAWAERGGELNYLRLTFWSWLYSLQKIPG